MILVNASVLLFCVAWVSASNLEDIYDSGWYPAIPYNLQDYFNIDNIKLYDKCFEQFSQYKADFKSKKWAMEMFDASTKFPTGVLSGSAGDLGNFDQCLNVKGITTKGLVQGKYCIGEVPMKIPRNADQNESLLRIGVIAKQSLSIAACFPDSCSAADIQAIYRDHVNFTESTCQTKDSQPKLDAVAITTIALLGVVVILMIISTIYDVFNYYSKRKPYHILLIAFSIFTNGKKLLTTNNNPGQITCLHGIRTITMMWIILGHRFKTLVETYLLNRKDAFEWLHDSTNSYMTGAAVAVDSFLFMSGLVISYSVVSANQKGQKFNILLFYIHRYLRLTPAYAVIILINVSLMKHLGSGPQWPGLVDTMLEQPCKKYWWSALLYVQNYVNPEDPCMGQSWYLSVDTQLFFLSPLLLLPFLKWPRTKPYVLLTLTIAAALTTFLVCWFEELYGATAFLEPQKWTEYVNKVYYPTHTRASPWIIGLATGYIIHATKNKNFVRMFGIQHHLMSLLLWIISLSILLACVYGSYDIMNGPFSMVAQTTYTAFTPPAWSIGLGLMILLCVHGYGGPVNWILSNPLMQVVSKFTYSMYLLHKMALSIYIYSARTLVTFSNFEVWHSFWGDFIFTFALAVFWVLAFESPVVTIEKVLFDRAKEKKQQPSLPIAAPQKDS